MKTSSKQSSENKIIIADIDIWNESIVNQSHYLNSLSNILNANDKVINNEITSTTFVRFKMEFELKAKKNINENSIKIDFGQQLGFGYLICESEFISKEAQYVVNKILETTGEDLNIKSKQVSTQLVDQPNLKIAPTEAIWVVKISLINLQELYLIIPLFTIKNIDQIFTTKMSIKNTSQKLYGNIFNRIFQFLKRKSSLQVVLGTANINFAEFQNVEPGDCLILNTVGGDSLEIVINGKIVGYGYPVVINNNFGVRVVKVVKKVL